MKKTILLSALLVQGCSYTPALTYGGFHIEETYDKDYTYRSEQYFIDLSQAHDLNYSWCQQSNVSLYHEGTMSGDDVKITEAGVSCSFGGNPR